MQYIFIFICWFSLESSWSRAEPNGGRRENYVGIRPVGTFDDLAWEKEVCVSCQVEKSTAFTLRGMCKSSYLETELFPTICRGYIGFMGNMVTIWYREGFYYLFIIYII